MDLYLYSLDIRLQEMKMQSQMTKQLVQEGEVDNLKNINLSKIKEIEEKTNTSMALNSLECKLDIKPIKEEMNKLIELDH